MNSHRGDIDPVAGREIMRIPGAKRLSEKKRGQGSARGRRGVAWAPGQHGKRFQALVRSRYNPSIAGIGRPGMAGNLT
jgi:hypothetical protein